MVRTQVQLSPAQAEAVKRYAAEQGISMAEVVRRSLEAFLDGCLKPTPEELRRRAMRISGIAQGGPSDIAERHDDYLSEALQ